MRWTFRPVDSPLPENALIETWANQLQISPLLAGLLWQRGFCDPVAMDNFLSPGLKHLAPPDQWPGLEQAAQVLSQAVAQDKKLAIWGDYDVDGVTSTALAKDFFAQHSIELAHHIPTRLGEGYGLNIEGVEALHAQGVRVLMTADCGITDCVPLARAKELGMRVVVTDHHLPAEELPPADAIFNPRLEECPCPDLCGVGVVFFLLARLNRLLPGTPLDMRQFLDLVALGTLADVVKLQGQNRILAKNGLLLITEAQRPGIAALKMVSGYAVNAALGAGQVVFGLAPRINAAGRMGHAEEALQLLLSKDKKTAKRLANKLDTYNSERRKEEDLILEQALEQAETQLAKDDANLGLVLYEPHWHVGIIGIVASRVVEKHYRPTLLLCEENGHIKGSGRSISEFDLHAGIQSCQDLLLGFGGHKQAAGLSLEHANLESLRKQFHTAVATQLGKTPLEPKLKADAELHFREIDFTLLKEIELMQPFGIGNPEPVFVSPPVQVASHRVFGKNHVKLQLKDTEGGVTLHAKAWRQAEHFTADRLGQNIRVAFSPKIDRYNSLASIDLRIKDWKSQEELVNFSME